MVPVFHSGRVYYLSCPTIRLLIKGILVLFESLRGMDVRKI